MVRKVLHRCFKISIFGPKNKSCLLHASEFPKMCNYFSKEFKKFWQRKDIYQALINRLWYAFRSVYQILCNCWLIGKIFLFCSQNRIFELLLCCLKHLICYMIGKILHPCFKIRIWIMSQSVNSSVMIIDLLPNALK